MTDKLIKDIIRLNNPTVVGLDTSFSYLPEKMQSACKTLVDVGKAISEFNFTLIDRLYKLIPAVKVQVAYYESYGVSGMQAFADTVSYAKSKGLTVIADVKRNDIGSTASCYSNAYLSGVTINGKRVCPFESDYVTVNGYLGIDGIQPFLDDCKAYDKGIFVLVKTSNPSSNQLQDKVLTSGETLYEAVADLVEQWGAETIGEYGYSSVGAVVGATHPAQATILRKRMPHTLFLIPGYGAQGGGADGAVAGFDERGLGGIVNNSRGIICAYKSDKYRDDNFAVASERAVIDMQQDLSSALIRAGKTF